MAPRGRHRLLTASVATAAALALAGLALELWLRCREPAMPMRWGWKDPYAMAGKRPAHELNQLGYRGRAIEYSDDDLVVLLVGDSQVEADACAFDEMPERRLEAHLRARLGRPVAVFSAGALGYGTDQQALALEEYFARFRADAVVVWLTPGNDPREVMLPVAPIPKPTFWLEGDTLCGPTARIGDPVPRGSRAWQWLRDRLRGPLEEHWHRHVLPPTNPPLPLDDQPVRRDWGIVSLTGDDFRTEFLHALVQLDPPSPRARWVMRLIAALLQRMAAATRAQGGVLLALADDRPDFPLPDGLYEAEQGGRRWRVRLSRRAYEENLAAMTAGVDLVRIPVTVRPFVAGENDPHLNAHAVDQVMAALAERLGERLHR
ncbi:MAG TPA: hypothetical protein VK081_05660 [Planctomycetota bacterium]|nr:hypothetical protein [Planctomycetota bacterium]